MITILKKLFIGSDNLSDPNVREKYGKLCSLVGIALNILLCVIKYMAGFFSGAIAVTADALNNLSDAGSSFITLIGFKLAGSKPDREHPYGHGRMEYVSGIFVSFLILLMSYEMIKSSVLKIIHPQIPNISTATFLALIFSIGVKLYMAYYNHVIGTKIDSVAMKATAKDSLSDVAVTSVVLISVLIGKLKQIPVDGIGGLVVGIMIFWAGISAIRETVDPLLGKAPDPELIKQVENIVLRDDRVLGMHDLHIHDYGPGRVMMSLHVEVPYKIDILELHELIESIEYDIRGMIGCEPTIHMDPVVDDDEEINVLKKELEDILADIDVGLLYHDLHIVRCDGYSNIIFDVEKPDSLKMDDEELKDLISDRVSLYNSKYHCIIQVDVKY